LHLSPSNEGLLDYNLTTNKKQPIKEKKTHKKTKKQKNELFQLKLDHWLKLKKIKTKNISSYKKILDPCRTRHSNLEIEIAVSRIQTHSKMHFPAGSVESFTQST